MGRLIEFPCRDEYEDEVEWNYDDYYGEEEYETYDHDYSFKTVDDNCFKGIIRKLLIFILMRL